MLKTYAFPYQQNTLLFSFFFLFAMPNEARSSVYGHSRPSRVVTVHEEPEGHVELNQPHEVEEKHCKI